MTWSLDFSPVLPVWLIVLLGAAAGALAVFAIWSGIRGSWIRAAAVAALVLALLNPVLQREDREALPSVVALVVDKSQSQALGDRRAETERARAQLAQQIGKLKNFEIREVEAGADRDGVGADGTRLFEALGQALSDVPPDRVAGAVMVTDGQVHDVPRDKAALGFDAPVHVLLTGRDKEVDRRVAVVNAPRFGLVGTDQVIQYRVIDAGVAPGGRVRVTVRRDGEQVAEQRVAPGEVARVSVKIKHGGDNILEIEAEALPNELTAVNNRAVATIEGIRENLRVLLVSGEPHAGERTWRNLLKSDASVDLVHFTILRPPEKQDGTPIHELSLIAFPTRELFQEKIKDFDLIIFDRYQRRGILPSIYFDNIARYVREGGAVLVASGPDPAGAGSLFRTPLASVLPAEPNGTVREEAFYPKISELGQRHPVTRALPGSQTDPPQWSRWFRLIESTPSSGTTVMTGVNDKPALILSREGAGRVGLLLSDHVWLWARGYEGGGPHGLLLRRLAHWLMKEPDLEEEALRLVQRGRDLVVERQTLGVDVKPVTITKPTGETIPAKLEQSEPGLWRAQVPARELGLWRVTDGERTALAHIGPPNPREFTEVLSSAKPTEAITQASGGSARRLVQNETFATPRILPLRAGVTMAGSDWIGLKTTDASVLKGVDRYGLFAGLLGLALLLGAVSLMWWREGR
ncbi:hypothetical protein [Prosthecomicrobium sp. N25]|uniref:hypothetical protein n=1 Tax=Prosthecomicrobium sp. N25 TaxID=3129254 RepID=UPI0030772A9E